MLTHGIASAFLATTVCPAPVRGMREAKHDHKKAEAECESWKAEDRNDAHYRCLEVRWNNQYFYCLKNVYVKGVDQSRGKQDVSKENLSQQIFSRAQVLVLHGYTALVKMSRGKLKKDYRDMTNNYSVNLDQNEDLAKLYVAFNEKPKGILVVTEHTNDDNCSLCGYWQAQDFHGKIVRKLNYKTSCVEFAKQARGHFSNIGFLCTAGKNRWESGESYTAIERLVGKPQGPPGTAVQQTTTASAAGKTPKIKPMGITELEVSKLNGGLGFKWRGIVHKEAAFPRTDVQPDSKNGPSLLKLCVDELDTAKQLGFSVNNVPLDLSGIYGHLPLWESIKTAVFKPKNVTNLSTFLKNSFEWYQRAGNDRGKSQGRTQPHILLEDQKTGELYAVVRADEQKIYKNAAVKSY